MNRPDGRIDEWHENRLRSLALPVLLGTAVGLAIHLLQVAVVLLVLLSTFDYSRSFEQGDAVGVALAGGLALVLAGALGTWITRRRALVRDVSTTLVGSAGMLTGLLIAVAVLLLGAAPGLRAATAPIYLLAAVAGPAIGLRIGKRH
jgi:hypothetical protein